MKEDCIYWPASIVICKQILGWVDQTTQIGNFRHVFNHFVTAMNWVKNGSQPKITERKILDPLSLSQLQWLCAVFQYFAFWHLSLDLLSLGLQFSFLWKVIMTYFNLKVLGLYILKYQLQQTGYLLSSLILKFIYGIKLKCIIYLIEANSVQFFVNKQINLKRATEEKKCFLLHHG